MDGIGRALGVGTLFRVGRRSYFLRPFTLGGIAAAEHYLLLQRGNPAYRVLDLGLYEVDQDAHADLWSRSVDDMRKDKALRVVPCDQMFDWLSEDEGMAFSAWWCLRASGCRFFKTLEGATRWIADASLEDKRRLLFTIQSVSGTDLLASLDWPRVETPETELPESVKQFRAEREAKRREKCEREGKPYRPPQQTARFIPWRKLLKNLGETPGWLPHEVAQLTLYQLKTYQSEDTALGGLKTQSIGEAVSGGYLHPV